MLLTGKPLERHWELQETLLEFSKLFTYEEPNDRAIAVTGGAFLESLLEYILKDYFPENDKEVEELFEYSNALGTYSFRLRIAYSLGLIEKVVKDDLKIVGKIRNKFAHRLSVTFEDAVVSSWCKSLQWHRHFLMVDPPKDASNRELFQVGVNTLISYLHGVTAIARTEKRRVMNSFGK